MTEKEKMIKGEIYDSSDAELTKMRGFAHELCREYNQIPETDAKRRAEILEKLLPNHKNLYLQGPIQFDYGAFTTFGENCYANFNLVILDVCPVNIGNNVLFGPNCSVVTPLHPVYAEERKPQKQSDGSYKLLEFAKPITIKDNVWCAANVTICGGVTIGENCVIGAGSVVTRDIPPNSFAAGVPCKAIREITEKDKILK